MNTQVSAVAALLECVRHEGGPAAFSNRLYTRMLTALVLSPTTQPEVGCLHLRACFWVCWQACGVCWVCAGLR
jgi:hypothetical protein